VNDVTAQCALDKQCQLQNVRHVHGAIRMRCIWCAASGRACWLYCQLLHLQMQLGTIRRRSSRLRTLLVFVRCSKPS
jgi:hypothetical protein